MFTKYRFLSIFFLLLVLCGCTANDSSGSNEVYLCDYKKIPVTEDMNSVSQNDLNAAMTMYAISADIGLEDHKGLTDEIVSQHFGCGTVDELKERALWDMVSHRIVESIYEEILLNSRMEYQSYAQPFDAYYSRRLSSINHLAEQADMTVPAFLTGQYQMTEAEFREYEVSFYITIRILEAILEEEKMSLMPSDLEALRSELALEAGMSVEETYQLVLDEDLFYALAEERMNELIAQWYDGEIKEAYAEAKEILLVS